MTHTGKKSRQIDIEKINPIYFLKNNSDYIPEKYPWIKYDPNVVSQYKIIRSTAHDGTLLFTKEVIARTLIPICDATSFYKPEEDKFNKAKDRITYVIGDIELETEFKK